MIKVLFADSKIYVARKIQQQLSAEGFQIQSCTDGLQVMEVFHKFKPDITILDLDLFKKSGEQCLEEIKKIDPRSIVVMTSIYPGENHEVEFNIKVLSLKEKGADGFLLKPIKKGQLIKKIRDLLRISEKTDQQDGE